MGEVAVSYDVPDEGSGHRMGDQRDILVLLLGFHARYGFMTLILFGGFRLSNRYRRLWWRYVVYVFVSVFMQ